jgi:hypothetical protein
MISYKVRVSREVKDLLDAIDWLEFGEINNVEVLPDPKKFELSVSEQKKRLIDAIHGGSCHLHKIQVHQSNPTYAEVPERSPYNHDCRRKLKFI